jgi:hypothetical protein
MYRTVVFGSRVRAGMVSEPHVSKMLLARMILVPDAVRLKLFVA